MSVRLEYQVMSILLRARISLDADSFRSVPLPSVKNVVDVLEDLCEDLLGTLKDIVDISSDLTHRDHVRIDNIEEVSTDCRIYTVPLNNNRLIIRLSEEMLNHCADLTQANVAH